MKITLREKGMNLLSHYILVRDFSYATSNENTRCNGSSGKIIGKTREKTGKAADESEKRE